MQRGGELFVTVAVFESGEAAAPVGDCFSFVDLEETFSELVGRGGGERLLTP